MKAKRFVSSIFRRALSLTLALMMLVSVLPVGALAAEGDVTVYLKPNANWLSDSARFAVYYFKDTVYDGWTDLTETEDAGVYEAKVPGDYTLIFCRMNPANTVNDWKNNWNQTGNLTPEDRGENDLFTMDDGSWDSGTWSVLTAEGEVTPGPKPEPEPEEVYYVAGNASLCGTDWTAKDENNKMTKDGDVYKKVYTDVAPGSYQLKVTDGTWNNNWGADGYNSPNCSITVSSACDVTVTFDPAAGTVTITGDGLGEDTLEITAIRAVGNGNDSGSWLNGVKWDPASDKNTMTEVSTGVYEITFEDVAASSSYEIKFAANGTWDHTWGGAFSASGEETDAYYNGNNIKVPVEYELADVKVTLDLSGFKYSTKSGAKFTVTITDAAEVEEPQTDYYLFGYINGANYGCEEDSANTGIYKFENGTLKATFDQDSYVAVKTGDNAKWYMTDGYPGDNTTSVTLYDTSTLGENSNKMRVPGGKEATFTLAENTDGTLALSYTVPTETPDPEPEASYYVAGNASLCGTDWTAKDENNKMTKDGDVYKKVYTDVAPGSYLLKVTDGTWDNNWGADGYKSANCSITVSSACDVTVTFDPAAGTVTITGDGLGEDTLEVASVRVGGNGSGNWLNGVNWTPNSDLNLLTETSEGVYEITYKDIPAGSYQFKFAANQQDWNYNWGGTFSTSGEETEAVYNGSNITFDVAEASNVTLKLDLTSFDYGTKSGAKFTVTVTKVDPTVTIHFQKPAAWETVNAYIWTDGGALPGYEDNNIWPGKAITANADHAGWYDLTIQANVPDGFKFILNNGNGSQTCDLETGAITGSTELWVTATKENPGSNKDDWAVLTSAPDAWTGTPERTFTAHFHNTDNWESVYAYAFYNNEEGVNTEPFGIWPGTKISENEKNPGWFDAETTAKTDTFTIIFNNNAGDQTANIPMNPGKTDLTWEIWVEGPAATSGSATAPETWKDLNQVTIHYYNTDNWSPVNLYIWTANGALPGYSANNGWPGVPAVPGTSEKDGWVDAVIETDYADGFSFIFNGAGGQTPDLKTGPITGDTELWVVGKQVLDTAPGEWGGSYTYDITLHYHNVTGWPTVNAKFGMGTSWEAVPGFEDYKNNEFGGAMEANPNNPQWNTIQVTLKDVEQDASLNGLFNNGSWGDSNQTPNWQLGGDSAAEGFLAELKSGKNEFWYDLENGKASVSTTAPAGWSDPNRTAHVPGTFPGPSWDPASNQMTYDPELGLYVLTFENVPAANYEFKIAINGSWDENYGRGGIKNSPSDNISVTVPKTMDVTVYFSYDSKLAVTNVDYVFADISLSGTGIPEGTKLTDPGLKGIYSAEVDLPLGTYEDITLTYNGETFPFAPFEVTREEPVTFYFDPATGMYYHDASDQKVGADAVFYDSKDLSYKAPFGAVEQNTDVTFTLDTGDDVTQAKLVVKGLGSFDMAKPEVAAYELGHQKWTATVQFPNMGTFQYYFALSNGTDMKVYCDDDGNYGTGKLCELTEVLPYEIVVFKSGFETPDWMKNAVIYQIFPDRFFDGNVGNNQSQLTARGDVLYEYIPDWYTIPENPQQEDILDKETYESTGAHWGDGEWSNEIYGGDLEGITKRIDYLKALGVNVIYLNPVFSSISSHRYDACDYMKIDPILGDLGDFTELVNAAEANGMKIILDGVFNHVSDDSIYFDRYYKFVGKDGKLGAYPYWAYVYDEMNENGTSLADAKAMAKTYFEGKGVTDFTYVEWFDVFNKPLTDDKGAAVQDAIGDRAGKDVYGYDGWWGYDSMPIIKSTNGSEYQTGNGTWANEIISGPNSVTQYWIRKGNDGWRLDVANEVSDETWQRFRQSVKGLNSDAVIVGEIWDDATKYLMGDMYDSVMNYLFRNAVTGFAKGTKTSVTATEELERIRERYPEEAFYAMMNLVGSHDTTRVLSYLDGIDDDRNQTDIGSAFPTYAGTSSAAKQMQYLVAFLQFTYPGAPTIYYGDEIGMVGADDPDDRRAMEWGKGSKELVEWYAKLAAIREAYPALRTGDISVIDTENDHIMGFTRSLDGVELIVLANNSATHVSYPMTGYVDIVTGMPYGGSVPGRNGVILAKQEDVKTVSVNYSALKPAYDPAYTVADRPAGVHVHQPIFKETVAPTCDHYGYDLYICKDEDCNWTSEENKNFNYAPHEMTTTTDIKPTCSTVGYLRKDCENCDHYTAQYLPKNPDNHKGDPELQNKKDATCTEDGYTGDKVCPSCKETLEAGKKIEKLGHEYKDGYCIRCGERKPFYIWSNPKSGDDFDMRLYIGIMVVSAAAIVVLVILKKKSSKKK